MTYEPHRDERFEYLWDLMHFIEENQCRTCAFSKLITEKSSHAEEYPMCYEIEGELIQEIPVAALDDCGDEGVVCTLYRNAAVESESHPDQSRLF